jgi:dTDP-4-dehydrorhamnose reductase
MRLLVTGADGQVGWELIRSLAPLGETIALNRRGCDLARPEALPAIFGAMRPDVIVNAAAYTAVDRAEEEEAVAMLVNGTAPGVLAEAARAVSALLIHYSTDYVFDGKETRPYREEDAPCPINAYGRSKLAGENAVRQVDCDHLVLRTSWVYAARGQNFVRTVLRLASNRDELRIVADQIGTPNWARHLADATAHVVRQAVAERAAGAFTSGLFHLTSAGAVSWHGFAQAIIALASREGLLAWQEPPPVHAIPTEEYPRPAARPKNSTLAGDRLHERFDLALPHWKQALTLCLRDVVSNSRDGKPRV